jgi:hypothetical protein
VKQGSRLVLQAAVCVLAVHFYCFLAQQTVPVSLVEQDRQMNLKKSCLIYWRHGSLARHSLWQ